MWWLVGVTTACTHAEHCELSGACPPSRSGSKFTAEKQMKFFDHFLKGMANDVPSWPKVRMEVRDRYYEGTFRNEKEFPLARTDYQKLYLDAASTSLQMSPVVTESDARYDPKDDTGRACFDFAFTSTTEITGYMKLYLWVSSVGSDDMDLVNEALNCIRALAPEVDRPAAGVFVVHHDVDRVRLLSLGI